jgi:fructose-1,6-bisphosphatase/inositol monophosphatase family enzyme
MTYEAGSKGLLEFLTQLTERAGKAILAYSKGNLGVDLKDHRPGAIDIVTDADRASEDLIIEAINREFPEHDILTEERSIELKGSRWLWLVDPLDGTVNFAHGYPMFSVSIALMDNSVLVAGMIYDPLKKEGVAARPSMIIPLTFPGPHDYKKASSLPASHMIKLIHRSIISPNSQGCCCVRRVSDVVGPLRWTWLMCHAVDWMAFGSRS